jgi:LacI family transcriptional regulator
MTRRTKHPTLSEVAKKAGVGTTTASRVINGGQNVDPKTLARVQRAIASLGYVPNQAARTLKGGRTRTIGFVLPSIVDPFFASCAEAAQAIARLHDSLLIVLTTQNDPKTELDAVDVLIRHRVDGLIIAPCNAEDDLLGKLLSRASIPVVALDRPIAGSMFPSVVGNNFAGAQFATRHLIEHGYRRIVCFTGEPDLYTIRERIRGYCDAMTSARLKPVVDSSIRDRRSAERALKRVLGEASSAEALLTLKNSTTIDTFEVLQENNVEVPGKIALLGYDDFQLAPTVRPSVSVIQQPIDDMGHVAAELLFKRLLDSASSQFLGGAPPQQVLLTTKLIRRASCGCSPEASRP